MNKNMDRGERKREMWKDGWIVVLWLVNWLDNGEKRDKVGYLTCLDCS